MDRPQWYSESPDGRRSSLHIPPLKAWSGNSLLLLALVVMFFLQLVLPSLHSFLELRPSALINPLNWYQLVTYSLLHNEHSLLHLGFNCLVLFFLGPPVESILRGRRNYLLFCAAAAAFAALAYVVEVAIRQGPSVPMIGASGICYAVLLAFATHDPQQQLMLVFPPIAIKAWALAAILMTASLFWQLMDDGDGVAHIAHLGGGLFGFLFIRQRSRIQSAVAGYQARRQRSARQGELDRKKEVDRILDKIHDSGIGSLSRTERKFLDSASRELRDRP